MLVLGAVLVTAGCAAPTAKQAPAPVETRGVAAEPTDVAPQADVPLEPVPAPAAPPEPRPPEQIARAAPAAPVTVPAPAAPNAAASSLLDKALKAATRGEWDRAQAALERAVRVDPDDHALWRQLAYTHYRRGDSEQALLAAERSLDLAADELAARRQIWNLIADIQAARGDEEAAIAARLKAANAK